MATRLDQDSKKMLIAQSQPVGGFRPQQAAGHIRNATLAAREAENQLGEMEARLAAGLPVGDALGRMAESAGGVIWELAQALTSMGLSTEAILGLLRERVLTGVMLDIGFLTRAQLFTAVGPVAGEELVGSLTAGLPIAGDEVPSYAVSPEPHVEAPPLEKLP